MRRLDTPLRINWKALLALGIGIGLLALVCMRVIQQSSSLASVWLPTALLIPVLFHYRYRDWIPLLCAAALGLAAANTLVGTPFGRYWPYIFNNMAEAAFCALLLRKFLPANDPLSGLAN